MLCNKDADVKNSNASLGMFSVTESKGKEKIKKHLGKDEYWMCEYKMVLPKLKTRHPRAIIHIQELMRREEKENW